LDQTSPIKSITNSPTKDAGSPYKHEIRGEIPILVYAKSEIKVDMKKVSENLKLA